MTDHLEVSDAMVDAALKTGKALGVLGPAARFSEVRRMLAAGLAKLPEEIRSARFDLVVSTGITRKKARFFGAGCQRGYLYVECEDGQRLHVHANEIEPTGRKR